MAQAMVDLYKKKRKIDAAVQTNELNEIFLYFSQNKTGRLYYSTVFKQHVLALNISSSKSFIMNASVWEQFKNSIADIDNYFKKNEQCYI
jgi:replicative DNA helicase